MLARKWDLILFPRAWGTAACAWTEHPLCGWGLCDSTQFLLCFFLGVATHNISFVPSPTFSPSLFSASQTPPAQCLTLPSIGIAPPLHTHSPSSTPSAPLSSLHILRTSPPSPLCAQPSLRSPLQPLDELFILTASNPASTQTLHSVYPSLFTAALNSQTPNPTREGPLQSPPQGNPQAPLPEAGQSEAPGPPLVQPVPPHPGWLSQAAGTGRGAAPGGAEAGAAVAGSERGAQLGQRLVALGLQGHRGGRAGGGWGAVPDPP